MQTEKTKTLLATVGILVALVMLYLGMAPRPPKMNRKAHQEFGKVLAEQAVKLLGSGGKVSIISRDTSLFENPVNDYQLEGLYEGLRKAKVTIVSTNFIKQDPERFPRVPPSDFAKVLRRSAEVDVVVSFLGPPVLPPEDRAGLTDKNARVIAVCSGGMPRRINLKELFTQNLLQAAIISRPNPEPGTPETDNPRSWFDRYYQVITPANAAELPNPDTIAP